MKMCLRFLEGLQAREVRVAEIEACSGGCYGEELMLALLTRQKDMLKTEGIFNTLRECGWRETKLIPFASSADSPFVGHKPLIQYQQFTYKIRNSLVFCFRVKPRQDCFSRVMSVGASECA